MNAGDAYRLCNLSGLFSTYSQLLWIYPPLTLNSPSDYLQLTLDESCIIRALRRTLMTMAASQAAVGFDRPRSMTDGLSSPQVHHSTVSITE